MRVGNRRYDRAAVHFFGARAGTSGGLNFGEDGAGSSDGGERHNKECEVSAAPPHG